MSVRWTAGAVQLFIISNIKETNHFIVKTVINTLLKVRIINKLHV